MFSRFPGLSNMFGAPPANPNPNNRNQPGNANPNAPSMRQGNGSQSINHSPSVSGSGSQHADRETRYSSSGEIDNSWAVMSKVSALYHGKAMSDITLVIGRREYPSHRLILCASSDVFQAMLMGSNWLEAQSERVELQETLDCAEYFEDFLKYLYTGLIRLELVNVLHLLTLADKYNIKDLVDLCLDYMIKHIPAAANHCKLIQWYKHLARRGHEAEAQACKNFIKWNFEFVTKSADFIELDSRLLTNILLEDDLVVYDEHRLFQCVNDWIEAQVKKLPSEISADSEDMVPDPEEKLARIVEESMECIRFPMMSPRQLADLVLVPIAQKYKDYFMEKMAIGVAFHSDVNQVMDLILRHPHRAKLFTPRHYCTDKWSVCLSVDNFHALSHYNSKTLVFSTPLSFSETNSDKQTEWVVDLYPKGVCFGKFFLIVWQGTLECPDQIMKTVRLAVHCKNEEDDVAATVTEQNQIRVQIGVLIAAVENDVEHVKRVIKKNYIFSGRDKVLNFDDIIPYDELVKTLIPNAAAPASECQSHQYASASASNHEDVNGPNPSASMSTSNAQQSSSYLCNDSLKIRIVITPMSEIKI